jgi:hypothetical protein
LSAAAAGDLSTETTEITMKIRMLWTAVATAVAMLAAGPALAQTTPKGDAAPDPSYKASGTHESRAAARQEKRKEVGAANKKGETTAKGEAAQDPSYKASGTHDTRSAERKEKRKEIADAKKKGEIKSPTESGPKQ